MKKTAMPKISLFAKKEKALALEIGEEWLKMVGIEEQGAKRRVICIGHESIKDLSEVEISQKILAFLKAKALKPNKVIISHPAHTLTTRILSLPSTDKKEIADILELQAVKQTPYSREEITIGFDILETDDKGYSRVLLAIAQCDIASRYYRIAEMAGCMSGKITLSFDGTRRWFHLAEKEEALTDDEYVILLNVDWLTTDMFILKGERLIFARSVGYGASHLTTRDAMENQFLSEIQRSLETAVLEIQGGEVKKLFLTGMSSPLGELSEILAPALNVSCNILPVLDGFEKSLSKDAKKEMADLPASFASVAGFAFDPEPIQINLIPPEINMRKGLEARAKDLALLGTLLLAFVTLVSAIGFERIYKKSNYAKHLNKQYQSIKTDAQEVERLVAKMKLANEQMNVSHNFLDVLYDINDVLPTNIYLTSLQYNASDGGTTIRGISEDMSSVFQFLSTLEATPHLELVKTRNVTKRKIDDQDVSEFEIVANLEGAQRKSDDAELPG